MSIETSFTASQLQKFVRQLCGGEVTIDCLPEELRDLYFEGSISAHKFWRPMWDEMSHEAARANADADRLYELHYRPPRKPVTLTEFYLAREARRRAFYAREVNE